MIDNYWIKDATRQEIITKTAIPNKGNFKLLANYFNLIDWKGLSFQFDENIEIQSEKLFTKNDFRYLVLQNNRLKELHILPCKNLFDYTYKIVSQVDSCQKEEDVLSLLIATM